MKTTTVTTDGAGESFGVILKRLRNGAGQSLRDLGYEANVPHSVIAAIESGRRSVSTEVALRLAEALHVKDKDAFLLKAISTTKRRKILPFACAYGAGVLNCMAIYLANAGVSPNSIADTCFVKPPFTDKDVDEAFMSQAMEKATQQKMVGTATIDRDVMKKLPRSHFMIRTKDGQKIVVAIHAFGGPR